MFRISTGIMLTTVQLLLTQSLIVISENSSVTKPLRLKNPQSSQQGLKGIISIITRFVQQATAACNSTQLL